LSYAALHAKSESMHDEKRYDSVISSREILKIESKY